MAFDPCQHEITQIIINAGGIIRKLKGLPEEMNITALYNETAPLLGILVVPMSSRDADHMPTLSEAMAPNGKFLIPRRDCPQCGRKESHILYSICPSCTDSEGGKYKSMWFCGEMDLHRNLVQNTGCGFTDKSEKFFSQWITELGVEIPTGTKESLGIKTVTDKGLK
jgi:hypothetical protein